MSYLDERRKHIEDGRPLPPKKKYTIPKKSSKRIQKEKEQGVQIVKPKLRPKGWFQLEDEVDEMLVNEEIVFITPAPESFDGKEFERYTMDEMGMFETPNSFAGGKGSAELERWFIERHSEFTGICKHCGGKSSKGDPKYWKFSVAHVLAKSLYPSIACHPLNAIELCFWSPSCHKNYDDGILPLTQLNCFDEVITKIVAMYPFIDKKERRRLPDYIMQYIDIER